MNSLSNIQILSGNRQLDLSALIKIARGLNRITRLALLSKLSAKISGSFTRLKNLLFRKISFTRVNTSNCETITWTTIPATDPSDRDIYVSDSTGVDSGTFDATHGSITNPYQTLSAGIAQMRDGHGDRMWLKKGDTWTNQNFTNFTKSGVSSARPMIIGSYGTGARPIIDPQASQFLTSSVTISNIWMIGLKCRSSTYNGTTSVNAIQFTTTANNILIEDCEISNCSVGAYWAGSNRHSNAELRGCQFLDCYSAVGGNAMGLIIGACDGVLVDFCTFDDCGWKPSVPGSTATIFLHSIYIQGGDVNAGGPGCTGVTVNATFNFNTDGMQLRGGGTCTNNLVSRTRVGYVLGIGSQQQQPSGAQVTAEDNVCLESQPATTLDTLAVSYRLGGVGIASTFNRNIAGRTIGTLSTDDIRSIWFTHPGDTSLVASALVSAADNILWHCGYWAWDNGTYGSPCFTFTGNDFQIDPLYADSRCFRCNPASVLVNQTASGNNYFSSQPEASGVWGEVNGSTMTIATWVGPSHLDDTTATFTDRTSGYYLAPERTLGQYYVSLGFTSLGTETLNHAAFVALARSQTKDTWVNAYTATFANDWIRKGFNR